MTKVLQKIIVSFLTILMIASNCLDIANAVSQNISVNAVQSQTQNNAGSDTSDQSTSSSQFLTFHSIGETQKVDSSLLNCSGEIVYSSSDPASASVSDDGTVTWLSGTNPILINAYEKANPDNKIQYFASFDDTNSAANTTNTSDSIQDDVGVGLVTNAGETDPTPPVPDDTTDFNVNNIENTEENTSTNNTQDTPLLMQQQFQQYVPPSSEGGVGADFEGMPVRNDVSLPLLGMFGNTFQPMMLGANALITTPQIAQGSDFMAILKLDGTVWTVGNNNMGQLGDGTTTARTTLGKVQQLGGGDLTDVVRMAVGEQFGIALKSDGTVWTWGFNDSGQLGDNTTTSSPYAKQVLGLLDGKDITYITAGAKQAGVMDTDGFVYLWGHNNFAQLGINNITTPQKLPVQPFDFGQTSGQMQGVKEIAMGIDHTVFLRDDGTVWTVGRQNYGELGNTTVVPNNTARSNLTLQVMAPGTNAGEFLGVNTPKIASIAAGYFTSGAVDINGNAYMWGKASNGVLGQGNSTNQTRPVVVKDSDGVNNLANVKKLQIDATAADGTAIAVTTTGKVYTWGFNNNGQLGDGTTVAKSLPIQPLDAAGGNPKFTNAIDIAISNVYQPGIGYSSSVLTADGKVYVFGLNNNGELGLGDKTNRTIPTQLMPSKMQNNAGSLNLTVNSSAALNIQYINGFNVYNTVQSPLNYTYESQNTNIATVAGSLVTGKKAGWTSIKVTETNSKIVEYVPVYVTSSDIQPEIVQGIEFTAVLKSDGTVWTVGNNNYGQLGDGTTTARGFFGQVKGANGQGFLTGVKDIAAGKGHVVALKTDGTVWTWGYNEYGQLGNNTVVNSPYPQRVDGILSRKNNHKDSSRRA